RDRERPAQTDVARYLAVDDGDEHVAHLDLLVEERPVEFGRRRGRTRQRRPGGAVERRKRPFVAWTRGSDLDHPPKVSAPPKARYGSSPCRPPSRPKPDSL